jgi:threonylcarbamoyladenosine tRNA methylthiotransferase MtaB
MVLRQQEMNIDKKKVAFHTLGCKLNFAETSTMSRSFPEERFERVSANSKADIYVINTCSVTDAADRKCRQAIKKFITLSPDAVIAVVGCYAQLKPQEISAIPGVDLVLGTNEKFDIARYLEGEGKRNFAEVHSCDLSASDSFNASFSLGDRTRSFLKVQDGCDYGCSYCTIPMARGNSRNPGIEEIISEARSIALKGVREVVLTGVNIGDFGKSTGGSFLDLLKKLVSVEGIERYRISSIEPNLLTDDIIRLAAENNSILPHFHIPLQSGCNRILALMRRRYRRELFEERVRRIKDLLPQAGIGADVIVGFPGETEEDFEDTLTFLQGLPLSYLHVFSFSERPGTVAAGLEGKVQPAEKVIRSKTLIALSETKAREFSAANAGRETTVLFERARTGGMMTGFTDNYIRVEHEWDPKLAGEIRKVKLTSTAGSGRMGIEIID